MGLLHNKITLDQTRGDGIVAAGMDNGIDNEFPIVTNPDAYLLAHFTTAHPGEGKGAAGSNLVLE
jgi:hypothetical protein